MRKLDPYLREHEVIGTVPGREALLYRHGITFQRTGTWKEPNDPDLEAKLKAIDDVLEHHPDRAYAFDEFGPLGIPPAAGAGWTGCRPPTTAPSGDLFPWLLLGRHQHSLGSEPLPQRNREHAQGPAKHPGRVPRRARDLPYPGQHLGPHLPEDPPVWSRNHCAELCFTPTYASWANPIEAPFGPLRQFTLANSNHPNHVVQTRQLRACLRWRNAHPRDPEVLEAQHRERARVRNEKGHRWGRDDIASA